MKDEFMIHKFVKDLSYGKRHLSYGKRDLSYGKRDLSYGKRDLWQKREKFVKDLCIDFSF